MEKIIVVCKFPPPYHGTSVWADTLRKSDLNKLFKIKYFDNNTHETVSTIGKIRVFGVFANIILYFKFVGQLISFRPNLVLIPFSQSAWGFFKDSVFMLLCHLLNIRRPLLILHGSNFRNWYKQQNWFIQWYSKKIICSSSGVIVLGNKLTSLFIDWIGSDHVYVVPNGLDVSIPNRSSNREKVVVTYLGNLQASKGIEDVVMAIKILNSKFNFEVKVVGSWPESDTREKCYAIKEEYGLPINFLDALYGEHKLKVLSETDIFVFPPRMPEGHPLVIVEAMAAGLPIISTDQGAITESVIDGVNGFIVAPNNPIEIADKIEYLIRNPDICEKMGRESRRLYEENFTEEKMVQKLARVFYTVLNFP